ncbi:MAG TPA: hypothetical protein PK040_00275 [Anaerolineaceae bacterium]|nr:hypothetical protein [Anaerolineaceae bacterium]
MFQLIRLGNCVHVFDKENNRFVKCTAAAVRLALGARAISTTRKEIIKSMQWARCADPACRFQNCRKGAHWIAKLTN